MVACVWFRGWRSGLVRGRRNRRRERLVVVGNQVLGQGRQLEKAMLGRSRSINDVDGAEREPTFSGRQTRGSIYRMSVNRRVHLEPSGMRRIGYALEKS